ncbi:MAG: HlyD family type I secretion periplasmic adaptor subunit [Gammaproteobacteria bacterium]
MTAQRAAKQRQVDLVTEELKDSKGLLAKGFIQKPHILGLEREMARARGQLGSLVAGMAETAAAISEKEQQILQVHNEFDAKVVDELREVQASLMDLAERYQAADHVLNNIEILAPDNGVVVNLAVFSARQVIARGETLMELVPIDDKLLIETRVETQNVDNVAVGMHADIKFTAIDRRNAPVLQGVIGYVSADASQDQRTGLSFFLVRIEVPTSELDKLGKVSIQPGMPAQVVIKFGERTVFEYLARPISDVITRAWKEE